MDTIYRFTKGKGNYGLNETKALFNDLLLIKEDTASQFEGIYNQLDTMQTHSHNNLAILNGISSHDIANWNDTFTWSEKQKIRVLLKKVGRLSLNNFNNKTAIPPFPWSAGSSLVTFKNYDDGNVAGNYLLVKKSVTTFSYLWDYLTTSKKLAFHFYHERNPPLTLILDVSKDISLDGFICFKLSPSSKTNFNSFAPDTDGAYARNTHVVPVLPNIEQMVEEYLDSKTN